MKKSDLINNVADTTGLSEADSKLAVDAVFDSIVKGLQTENQVKVFGFGTFYVKRSKRGAWDFKNERRTTCKSVNICLRPSKVLRNSIMQVDEELEGDIEEQEA